MGQRVLELLRRKLTLPSLLQSMIARGEWKHPGQDAIARAIPFIEDPLLLLSTHEQMIAQSGPLMGPSESSNEKFSEYRGSRVSARELPWIDVEKTLFIIINERIGDDVGVALDYRQDPLEPCVVAGDWHSSPTGIVYRHVANSFAAFVELLGIPTRAA